MVLNALKKLAGRKEEPAPAAAAWRAPRVLAQGPFQAPALALDAQGRATAVLRSGASIQALRFGFRQEPLGPVSLHEAPGATLSDPLLARTEETLLAAWTERSPGRTRILARFLAEDLGGDTRPAFELGDEIQSLRAIVDRRGDALLAWVRPSPEGAWVEALGYEASRGAWDSAPTRLDGPLAQPTPLGLVAGPKGSALAVWNHQGAGFEGLVASHYFGKERIWSDRPVGIAHALARSLDLAMDEQGNAALLYLTGERERVALDACVMSVATHAWHGPTRLASALELSQPRVAMAKGGAALAVWRQGEAAGATRLFSRAFQAGKWAPRPEALEGDAGTGRAHAFALSPEARGAVLWAQPAATATGGAEGIFIRPFEHGRWEAARPLGTPSKFAHHSLCAARSGDFTAALWLAGVGHCGAMGVVGK